jgi:hypothetical protein
MSLNFLLLYPFFKVTITNENYQPMLRIYLFKKRIINKLIKLRSGKANNVLLIKQMKLENVNLDASYGFKDPSITGAVCAITNIVSKFIHINSFYNRPNFAAEDDYIFITATAELSVGQAVASLLKYNK